MAADLTISDTLSILVYDIIIYITMCVCTMQTFACPENAYCDHFRLLVAYLNFKTNLLDLVPCRRQQYIRYTIIVYTYIIQQF